MAQATYSTIIGSNIGAYLTPIGALAGIMWMQTLAKHNIKFNFLDFIKYGIVVSIPTLLMALLGLSLILN
jgi:arsenical pump membrane protein